MDPLVISGIAVGFATLGGVIAALGKIIHIELTECKRDRNELHGKVDGLSTELKDVWKAMAIETKKSVETLKQNGHDDQH